MKLRKLPKVSVEARLTRPADIVCFLLGQELLFNVAPPTAFQSLGLKNADELLTILEATDNVVGNIRNWGLNPKLYFIAAESLKRRNVLKADLSPSKAPPAVSTLVKAFKAAQAPFPLECRASKVASLFVFFRALSRDYPPERILSEIPNFATQVRVSQIPKFNVEEFERFIKTRFRHK